MNKKIFSEIVEEFLRNEVCICISDLTNKILTEAPEKVDFFNKLFEYYIQIEFPYNPTEILDYDSTNSSDYHCSCMNYEFFEPKLISFLGDNELEDDSNALRIYDELYHALRSYTTEGLLGLYRHREPICWYPKIVINKNLGLSTDVESLGEEVLIYRGTSLEEFSSTIFSQSWTLDNNVAHNFAFIHYAEQLAYINTQRVVIQAKIYKNDIYFYGKHTAEEEVIVNNLRINSAEIIEQKELK